VGDSFAQAAQSSIFVSFRRSTVTTLASSSAHRSVAAANYATMDFPCCIAHIAGRLESSSFVPEYKYNFSTPARNGTRPVCDKHCITTSEM
jgi:hypothetical protein